MRSSLFLQSEVRDPFLYYQGMLKENPAYWDESCAHWVLYSYEFCRAILNNPHAGIPSITNSFVGLNECALLMSSKLARLSNGVAHEVARQTVMILFDRMKEVRIDQSLGALMKDEKFPRVDWVEVVCKKLPALTVMECFHFRRKEIEFVLQNIDHLVSIMSPKKTPEQIMAINRIADKLYEMCMDKFSKHDSYKSIIELMSRKFTLTQHEVTSFWVSNLVGLIIQSYEAGRGILSNSLLQFITNVDLHSEYSYNEIFFRRVVIESLRFDPPVHHTRRVLFQDVILNDAFMKKGQQVLVVLASANRDPDKFNDPHVFDISRLNNSEHLTFGAGQHSCPANQFSVAITTKALAWLFEKYKVELCDEDKILYEPTYNTRLPKHLQISLTPKTNR